MFCLQFKNKQKTATRLTFKDEKEVLDFMEKRSAKLSENSDVLLNDRYNIMFTDQSDIVSIDSALVNEFKKING